ncbi:AAA family ATPase [Fibrobacter sp. UWR2]|uniref:AAA family ATPase n=1 Tax=Fibrobacter sp. UWR2 TaxID=1964352 RepID=UPI001E5B2ECE|nr:AAA family ATPase [Fibrobacter sp. UWR2]
MKENETLFKAWSGFLQQESILNEDDLKNLQDVSFCRNHNFLGRYNIPVILLKSVVENDHKYDGRLYKRFFLFDKYSISNDWYHSETETNRRDFFRWFVDLCKQRGVYNKVPQIIIEEAESSDNGKKNDLFKNNTVKDKQKTKNTGVMSYSQNILFGAPGTGKSFKIDDPEKGYGLKNVDESRKFRTTFHPDYDYAQFVGAYKPQKNQVANKALNKNELTAILKEMKDGNNYPIHKFSALYSDSLLKLSNAEQIEIIKEADSPESMAVELKKGIAVGEYLKEKIDGGSITYSFVPQVFAKAYAAAWKQYFAAGNVSTVDNQVYLVIEEINRGNCAQIFGDIFQLLDRDSAGFSQYAIDADCDFAEWLKENGIGDGKLKLPPNLNILATMNTSDQSLFPMDSAFKRRFDWEYVPISFTDEEGNEKEAAKYEIDIPDANGKNYLWQNFVEAVNDKILDLTESEDKQLGEFFIKPDNGNIISKERFLGKVMFYLWSEVCKDEHKNGSFFRAKINDKEDFFTFQDLYKKKDLLKLFMDGLLAPKN